MIFDPVEGRERYGPLFCRRLLTMVDAKKNIAEVVETCAIPGMVEWDAVNRCRAGGAVTGCEVTGNTMVIRGKLGESHVSFNREDMKEGGQALEGIEIADPDRVRTKWAGIGRAATGVVACLPQSPGVISVRYPHREDMEISDQRVSRVEITTPLYEKVTVGVDDTDDGKGSIATWQLALRASEMASELDGVRFLGLKLIQLYPKSPYKMTNSISAAVSFAVRVDLADTLIHGITGTIKWKTLSENAGVVVYRGIGIPEDLASFGWEAKKRFVSLEEALALSGEVSIMLGDGGQEKSGLIGALAAVALSEERTAAAALYDDKALDLFKNEPARPLTCPSARRGRR
jgi:methanogenesis imperfect marker protein 11